MNGSMGALVGNANLIKKVYFPREVLVAARRRVVGGRRSLIELGVLCVALLIVGNMVLPWLPRCCSCSSLLQTLFVLGRRRCALGVLNVYFRDVQHLIGIVLQLWFYATPIIYPIALVPADEHMLGVALPCAIYELNPMVRFVERLPRPALRPALPADCATSLYVVACRVAHRSLVGLCGLPQARAAVWRRSCDGERRGRRSRTSRKRFRLYHERNQSLKAALMRGGRADVRGVLGARRRVASRCPHGLDVRADRRERLGQEHAAQVHGAASCGRTRVASTVDGKMSALLELGAGFHPELSGRENVYLNGSILGLSQEGARRASSTRSSTSPGSSSSSTRR